MAYTSMDRVKVLGTGPEADRMEAIALEAMRFLGLPPAVTRIIDPVKTAVYGAYAMPALVFGRQVVLYGRAPAFEEVLSLLELDRQR